jgi:ribosome-binding protein aMBF1 (putative translation factor)
LVGKKLRLIERRRNATCTVVVVKARMLHNLVGAQVRRFRWRQKMSQTRLAEKLQEMGWNISRARIARIEAGEACVGDIEHFLLSKVFEVKMDDLLPSMDGSKSAFIILQQLTGGQLKRLMSPDEIIAEKTARLLDGDKHFVQNSGQRLRAQKRSLRDDRF